MDVNAHNVTRVEISEVRSDGSYAERDIKIWTTDNPDSCETITVFAHKGEAENITIKL
jgi:hypothetical protein